MPPTYRVLLIEDNPGDARLVKEMLAGETRARVDLQYASTLSAALARLQCDRFDAALLDLGLPDSQGLETFTRLHDRFPELPAVVLTGTDDVDLAMRAVNAGAQDYLLKSEVSGDPLVRALQYAIERKKADEALRRRSVELQQTIADLQEFNRLSIGRELRMIELKKEVNELCGSLGLPPRYDVAFSDADIDDRGTDDQQTLAGTGTTS